MNRRRRLLIPLPLALAGLPGLAAAQAQAQAAPPAPSQGDRKAGPPPPVGTRLALPPLALLDGRLLKPKDLEGQVVVLYWWASWCPFCALQSPMIDRLDRAHRARGLRVVGLSVDRRPQDAAAYMARHGYAFASAWVTADVERALPKPKGLPVTVVLGRDGRVVMAEAGQLFEEDVEAIARFL